MTPRRFPPPWSVVAALPSPPLRELREIMPKTNRHSTANRTMLFVGVGERHGQFTFHGPRAGVADLLMLAQTSLGGHEGNRSVVILSVRWELRGKDQPARSRPSANHLPPAAALVTRLPTSSANE